MFIIKLCLIAHIFYYATFYASFYNLAILMKKQNKQIKYRCQKMPKGGIIKKLQSKEL